MISSAIADEAGARLLERLDFIRLQPQLVVGLEPIPGRLTRLLAKRYRQAKTVVVDNAWPLLQQAKRNRGWFSRQCFVSADKAQLPLQAQSVDCIFSHLTLSTEVIWQEFRRLLKPDGLLLFSVASVDDPSVDMHTIGDALLRTGLVDPVVDREEVIVGLDKAQIIYGLAWGAKLPARSGLLPDQEVTILVKDIKHKQFLKS